jgi:hypothetical protein
MVTKLTLTIEESIIRRAKQYAKGKNKSVSKLVAEYLDNISDRNKPLPSLRSIDTSFVENMVGIIPDDGRDYKELLDEAKMDWLQKKGFDDEIAK